MAAAFGWGTLAASSLVIGAVFALLYRVHARTVGLVMAFGAGVLISAVAFDLIEEAANKTSGNAALLTGLFAGCGVFFAGDLLIDAWAAPTARTRRALRRADRRSPSSSGRSSMGSPSRW
jgi:zinc transporter, ZIP family